MLLLLLACTPSHSSGSTEPAPTQGPPPLASPVYSNGTVTVTLDPRYMSYDEAKGIATFSPDSDRQMSEYTTWVLDLKSLESVVGRPSGPVVVTVELSSTDVKKSTPADGMPSPMGGFTYTTNTGKVVAKGG
jgi:hypothetical protein